MVMFQYILEKREAGATRKFSCYAGPTTSVFAGTLPDSRLLAQACDGVIQYFNQCHCFTSCNVLLSSFAAFEKILVSQGRIRSIAVDAYQRPVSWVSLLQGEHGGLQQSDEMGPQQMGSTVSCQYQRNLAPFNSVANTDLPCARQGANDG